MIAPAFCDDFIIALRVSRARSIEKPPSLRLAPTPAGIPVANLRKSRV